MKLLICGAFISWYIVLRISQASRNMNFVSVSIHPFSKNSSFSFLFLFFSVFFWVGRGGDGNFTRMTKFIWLLVKERKFKYAKRQQFSWFYVLSKGFKPHYFMILPFIHNKFLFFAFPSMPCHATPCPIMPFTSVTSLSVWAGFRMVLKPIPSMLCV